MLFLFLGLPLALSALAPIATRPWALDRETYKRFVQDDRLYAALQAPEMAARARRGRSRWRRPSRARRTARPRRRGPEGSALPEIKSTASKAIDAVFDGAYDASLRGTGVTLDLGQLKAALASRKARPWPATTGGLSSRSDPPGPGRC